MTYTRVYSAIRRLAGNPAFARRMEEALMKSYDGHGYIDIDGGEGSIASELGLPRETQRWLRQLVRMEDSHIFEFDPRVSMMLSITDNDDIELERHLPFNPMFIEADFELHPRGDEKYHYIGILLWENGAVMKLVETDERGNPTGKVVETKNQAPSTIFAMGYMVYDKDGGPTVIDGGVFPVTTTMRDFLSMLGVPTALGAFARMEENALRNVTLNFLDLLETPDAMLVEINRKRSNARRQRQGLIELPPGYRVIVRGNLKRYIYELEENRHFQYSHQFWVRGHFRHYRDPRYKEALGKRQWIYPYVKGQGILHKKRYFVPGGEGIPIASR